MITRSAKLLLLAGIALYFTLVVFNNLTDFSANYEFVRHVLSMDSTFPGNHVMWRALPSPGVHLIFYWMIIMWEFVTTILAWWGLVNLLRALRGPVNLFNAGKRMAVMALTLSMLMWLMAFSGCGRGVVPDVAVAYLERSGRGFSHVHDCRGRDDAALEAGYRYAGIAL